jgi:hypothetical protein
LSFQSCKASITPLIIAAVNAGGSVTVRDRNQQDTLIPPLTQMPLVLLRDRASAERPLAVGYSLRPWWLEMTLWAAFPIDTDQSSFDIMREQLAQVARKHQLIGGSAGDATFGSQIIIASVEIQQHDFPAIPGGAGIILRHCCVSTLINEGIANMAVV